MKVSTATEELQYLMDFNGSITQARQWNTSQILCLSLGNLTLARRDSYLSHLKTDTLAALKTVPLQLATLFPDNKLKRAEEDKVRVGKPKVSRLTTLPDQPRASSCVNDNYCVDKLQARLLTGSKEAVCSPETLGKTLDIQTPQIQVVNFSIVNPVLFGEGHSQRKDTRCCKLLQTKKIKICERYFLCCLTVFCQTCNKCPSCYLKSTCRVETTKLLESFAGSGCQSERSSNPQRGLHLPLSDPAKFGKVTDHHKLLCQSPQEPLPV